jgi:hypothetical protein
VDSGSPSALTDPFYSDFSGSVSLFGVLAVPVESFLQGSAPIGFASGSAWTCSAAAKLCA